MKRYVQSEEGLSLVEVLASIALLSLLLTSFLIVFINSAKTNKASEEVVQATYTAQMVMEQLYELSLVVAYDSREAGIDAIIQAKNKSNPNELIKVTLKPIEGTMEHVIVEVYEWPEEILRAKMQNVFVWEEIKDETLFNE